MDLDLEIGSLLQISSEINFTKETRYVSSIWKPHPIKILSNSYPSFGFYIYLGFDTFDNIVDYYDKDNNKVYEKKFHIILNVETSRKYYIDFLDTNLLLNLRV